MTRLHVLGDRLRPPSLATPSSSRCARRDEDTSRDMADYLLARSEGTIGELAHLLTDAVAAIESGEEAITQRTLLMAPYTGPTERRRLFERELA